MLVFEISVVLSEPGGDDGGGGGGSTQTETSKPGDVDRNGKVDIYDYNEVVSNFGKGGASIKGDLNDNGKVDIYDYNEVVSNINN